MGEADNQLVVHTMVVHNTGIVALLATSGQGEPPPFPLVELHKAAGKVGHQIGRPLDVWHTVCLKVTLDAGIGGYVGKTEDEATGERVYLVANALNLAKEGVGIDVRC